jgi:hypothetical protein
MAVTLIGKEYEKGWVVLYFKGMVYEPYSTRQRGFATISMKVEKRIGYLFRYYQEYELR